MGRYKSFTIAALAALALSACATMRAGSHIEPGANFTDYRTWDWGPAEALPTGDPRLDNNPFFQDYLLGAIERQMTRKGYVRSRFAGPTDLLVHYHTNMSQRFEVTGVDRERGYCDDDCEPRAYEYEQGTLVLDVIDARTKKVVWRGWAQDSMEGVIDDQDRLQRQVGEAVTKMFKLFPSTL